MKFNKITSAILAVGTLGLVGCNGGSASNVNAVNTVTANKVSAPLFTATSCLVGKVNFAGSGWYLNGSVAITNNCDSSINLKGQTISFIAQTNDGKSATIGQSSLYANNTNYSINFTSASANQVVGTIDAAASWDGKNLNGVIEKGQTLTFNSGANTATGGVFDNATANNTVVISGSAPTPSPTPTPTPTPVVKSGELDVVVDTKDAGCSSGVSCSDVSVVITNTTGQNIQTIKIPVNQLGGEYTTKIKEVIAGTYNVSASSLANDTIIYTPTSTPEVKDQSITNVTIKYTKPAPSVTTGKATVSLASVVPNYTGDLQVQILNAKESNAVVNTYTIKQGGSFTTEDLPVSDATHAYKVKMTTGIADPLQGLYYIESGLPVLTVKPNQTASLSIPMKSSTVVARRNVTVAVTGLTAGDNAITSFSDASNKYSYVNSGAKNNGNTVYKIENNLNLGITVQAEGTNYEVNPITSASVINANTTVNANFKEKITPTPTPTPEPTPGEASLHDWPNYLAMGTISNGVPASEPTDQRIDSIFTYNGTGGDGDPGRIESPYKIYNMLTMGQAIRTKTGHNVNPALVEYQWQLSGGWNPADVEDLDRLTKHFFNLSFLADVLQTQGPATTGTHGTILISPDLLGFIGNTNRQAEVEALKINVNQAVAQANCMMSKQVDFSKSTACKYNWDNQPVNVVGTAKDLMTWLRSQTDNYSAGTAFANCVGDVLVKSCANASAPAGTPTFTNNFNGWVQAQNYLAKKYGPDVNLGWHENISGAPGGGWWVHNGASAVKPYATAILNDLKRFEVFSGKYKPDFIYFDRYGADDYVGQMPSFHAQVHNQATFYNDQDWDNIIQLSKDVSEGLASGYGKNVPVMLWQIPAAHIHTTDEKVVEGVNDQEEGSAPVYFFGDPRLDATLSNIAPWINQGVGPLSEAGYGLCQGKSASQCLTLNKFNWGHTDNGKLKAAVDAHVFSILWGAGGFATGVWPVTGQTFYDNNWMRNTVNTYYDKRLEKLN